MAALPHPQSDPVAELRDALRRDRTALEQDYLQHRNAKRLLHAHSHLIDSYMRQVWRRLEMPESLALIAVGGYGRGELYPKSDIDLLILLDASPDEALQQRLHQLVGELWDIGLEVGHSIRTLPECMAESSDITVQTNLLETRLLDGNHELFDALSALIRQHMDVQQFFAAKQLEQQQRHARFVDAGIVIPLPASHLKPAENPAPSPTQAHLDSFANSVLEADHNLEPNIKESPGGLRDLQTIIWISRAAGLGANWTELAQAGLISSAEAREIARHNTLLQTLRIRLHYLAKRHEDRLLFDFQTALAEQMGIRDSANRRASEHMMQRYYRTKLAVRQFNAILLQNLHARIFRDTPPEELLNERFMIVGTMLGIRDENLFEHTPEAIFELFLLLEQQQQLTGLTVPTLRALWRAQHLIDAAFRRNPVNQNRFMEILRQPRGVIQALRRMNQYRILGRYIPAFGRIVGQMQHDLFHVYTVDEHTLMVVRNLYRFTLPEHAHELPLCSKLMNEFARPEVLYLAGLFHDIAKGRGGDHSILGKKDALAFCKQHRLRGDDRNLIVWLVEHHITMSRTSQRQDLSDPDVIAAFADNIKNDRYLVALYLLTVADMRGASLKVWNAWKASLLEHLFNSTRRYLSDGKAPDQLGEIRRESVDTLNLYGMKPDAYQLLWAQLDDNYFLDHEAHEIAWHTRLLAFKVNNPTPIVKARLSRIGEGLQILVYCPDQRSLFARICDFFSRMSYTIVEAKIHTTRHGYAINSFQIMEVVRGNTAYRDIMNYIEFELAQQILQAKPVTLASPGRVSRRIKHFPIKTAAEINPDRKKGLFVLTLVAGDRPGLLANVALILSRHDIRLHRAKINTLGSRAEDVFWISGEALADPEATGQVLNELREKI